MPNHHPFSPRRVLTGTFTAAALTAGVFAAIPAYAAPCQNPTNMICNPVSGGGSGGGTDGGGGGGGGGGGIPTLGGDDEGLGVGGNPAPPGPVTDIPTMTYVEQALASAELPVPTVHTSPEGRTYVKVRTGLWVDGFVTVRTEPVSAGDQLVQATAEPKSVEWRLGETTLSCNGPGRENSTECSYVYQRSSANAPGGVHRITATITWGVTWTCQGQECDAPGGTLADMTMTSTPTPLTVDEIQTNTRQ